MVFEEVKTIHPDLQQMFLGEPVKTCYRLGKVHQKKLGKLKETHKHSHMCICDDNNQPSCPSEQTQGQRIRIEDSTLYLNFELIAFPVSLRGKC